MHRLAVASGLAIGAITAVLLPSALFREGPAPASPAAEIRVIATEWGFDPPAVRVPAGQPVALVLENRGAVEHDIEVLGTGPHVHALAGRTARGTVQIGAPGTYRFNCTLPGHREAGMQGFLIVEPQEES